MRGEADDAARAILATLLPLARAPLATPRAVYLDECSHVVALSGRLRLIDGDAKGALADAEEAQAILARGLALSQRDEVTLAPSPVRLFVAAEALLRLQRPDEARQWLSRVPNMPAELLDLVPSLAQYRDDPRFASTLKRMQKR